MWNMSLFCFGRESQTFAENIVKTCLTKCSDTCSVTLALRCQEIFCQCFISIITSCVSSIILAVCSLPTVAQLVATPAINLQLASSQTIFNLPYTCRPGSCKHCNHTTVLYSQIIVELYLLQSQNNSLLCNHCWAVLTAGLGGCNHCNLLSTLYEL